MNPTGQRPEQTTELIEFCYKAPDANKVCLTGDFNSWNPTSHLMRRLADGSWFLTVPLSFGRHYYKFLVDGKPVLDPKAMFVPMGHNKVSLIAIS